MTIQFRWNGTTIVGPAQNQWQPNDDGTGAPLPVGINTSTTDATLDAITLASTAQIASGASSAVTLAAVTDAATAQNASHSSLAVTLGAATLSAQAKDAIAAALSQTLGAVTDAASATVASHGQAAQTLGAVTLAATGTVAGGAISADLSQTLGAVVLTATATVSQPQAAQQATTGTGSVIYRRSRRKPSFIGVPDKPFAPTPPEPREPIVLPMRIASAAITIGPVSLEATMTMGKRPLTARRRAALAILLN